MLAPPRKRGNRHGMQSGHINVDFIVVAGSSKAVGVPVGCMPVATMWPSCHPLLGWPSAWLWMPYASRDPPLPHHPCSPGDAHVTQPQTLSTCCTQQRVHDGRGAGGCRHRTLVRWGNGGPPTHAHTDKTAPTAHTTVAGAVWATPHHRNELINTVRCAARVIARVRPRQSCARTLPWWGFWAI